MYIEVYLCWFILYVNFIYYFDEIGIGFVVINDKVCIYCVWFICKFNIYCCSVFINVVIGFE